MNAIGVRHAMATLRIARILFLVIYEYITQPSKITNVYLHQKEAHAYEKTLNYDYLNE